MLRCEHPRHDSYGGGECPFCPDCDACDGTGHLFWEWYPGDGTLCTECPAEGVEVMGYGEDGEEGQVCLACYLAWHARDCGCEAWPKGVTP